MNNQIPQGHYAEKQLSCQSKIISWSHHSRFRKAEKLVGRLEDGKIVD